MAVELYIRERLIDLTENTRFQFNFTINDIFNIGYVSVGYSNVFEAPKTSNNTSALGGLGLVGSTSRIPYQKYKAVLKYNGYDIIPNGLLSVESTAVNYKLGVHDGMMNFFKDIENKTIGNDVIGIEELKHKKNVTNFKNSIIDNNSPYRYVVADFGGKMQVDANTISIDYLIPAVKLSYIWDKIFETFGYNYSGNIFSSGDFADAWITFPNAPDTDSNLEDYSVAAKSSYTDYNHTIVNGFPAFPNAYNWTTTQGDGYVDNWRFKSPTADTYRMRVTPVGYVMVRRRINGVLINDQRLFEFNVKVGGNVTKFISQTSLSADFSNYYFDFALSEGEEVDFSITPFMSLMDDEISYLQITSLKIEILKNSLGELDFQEAFTDFGVKDFVKEIVNRYGLTPIYHPNENNIEFLTINEKINFNNTIDWTEKYVEREEESYIFGSYAQANNFVHKYNEEGDSYNNGSISINNSNLEPSKNIVVSKIYSAENRVYKYQMNGNEISTNRYPVWRAEVKETSDGLEVDYKGLNGRYYIMKLSQVNNMGRFKSEFLNSNIETTPYYFVPINQMTHYAELVPKYYPKYEEVLNDFKMHKIELALSLSDIIHLDFRKLYYFTQEASYYILNKLTWEDGKTTKGEFIKVKR